MELLRIGHNLPVVIEELPGLARLAECRLGGRIKDDDRVTVAGYTGIVGEAYIHFGIAPNIIAAGAKAKIFSRLRTLDTYEPAGDGSSFADFGVRADGLADIIRLRLLRRCGLHGRGFERVNRRYGHGARNSMLIAVGAGSEFSAVIKVTVWASDQVLHIYDHSFPLRSKAPKGYETRYL